MEIYQWMFYLISLVPFWPTVTIVGIFILVLSGKKEKSKIFFITMVSVGIIGVFLKRVIYSPRPCAPLCGEISLFYNFNYGSFPSLHAMSSFAPIPLFHETFKNYFFTIFMFLFGILVSYSRIYIGVHYLRDVLVGSILGLGISSIILLGAKKLNFNNE